MLFYNCYVLASTHVKFYIIYDDQGCNVLIVISLALFFPSLSVLTYPYFKDEAGGTGKLPYKKEIVQATGLPQGMMLRKPNFYGKDQLKSIIDNAQQITLQISR